MISKGEWSDSFAVRCWLVALDVAVVFLYAFYGTLWGILAVGVLDCFYFYDKGSGNSITSDRLFVLGVCLVKVFALVGAVDVVKMLLG